MINAKRFNFILCGLLVLLAAGSVALTVYTNLWLTEKAQSLVTLKLDTVALEEKQRVNQQAAEDLEKNVATKVLLDKIVPKNKDQAKTIGELLKIGEEVGVKIGTMTFPSSELGVNASGGTVVGTTPTAAAASSSAVTQAKPVDNIPGLLGIEVSLSQIDRKDGESGSGMTYSQLITLLEAIEKNRRTMQIKTMQVQPLKSPAGSITGYSLTLTMNIFVKP